MNSREVVVHFLGGMTTMGFLACGLFFAKFWRNTREILFAAFAAAFALLSLHTALISVMRPAPVVVYVIAASAYGLIAWVVFISNMG